MANQLGQEPGEFDRLLEAEFESYRKIMPGNTLTLCARQVVVSCAMARAKKNQRRYSICRRLMTAQSMLVRSAKWSWLKAWAMKIARHRGMNKAKE
jgi:hypothetical protein